MPNGVPNGQLAVQLFNGAKAPPTTFLMPYGHPVQLFFTVPTQIPFFCAPSKTSTKIFPHFWIKQKDGSYEELSTEILNQKGWFWLIDYDEDGDIDIINRSSRFQQRSGEESYLSDEIFEW